ncbi:MAG: FHA domain-containing protein [Planctomycetia bacterium]|nr:FHA domain-containing protein [Planctomycetia bacterium]
MLGFLVPVGGGDTIPLMKEHLVVGRRDECDIKLSFSNVSGRHCEIYFEKGFWFVRDLQSSNGTKVNGVRVQEKCLPPGSEISFAKNKYIIEYEAPEGPIPDEEKSVAEDFKNVSEDNIFESIFSRSLLQRAGLSRNSKIKTSRRAGDDDQPKRYKMD